MAGHSTSARGFGFFDISVDLSQEGFDNVDEIIKIIFQVRDGKFLRTRICKKINVFLSL